MKYISSFLFILLVISGSLPAFSAETKEKTVIESIEYLGEKGAGELIQIELSKKIAPRVIKLPGASPRLVFDFVDSIKSKKIANTITADGKIISKVRVGIHNKPEVKVRVVIDLASNIKYKVSHGFEDSKPHMYILVSQPVAKVATSKESQKIKKTVKPSPATSQSTSTQEKRKQLAVIPEKAESETKQIKPLAPTSEKKTATPHTAGEKNQKDLSQEVNQILTKSAANRESSTAAATEKQSPVDTMMEEDASPEPADTEKNVPPVAVAENVNILEQQGADENIADENTADITDDEIPVLLNVSFERNTNDKEMVLFKLSGFHPPVVFSTEGEDLLVVCDFLEAVLGYGVEKIIETQGKYISKVEIVKHQDPEKVRVVLHLDGKYRYDLKQVFFKEDNLFVVMISNLGQKN